ncbi:MAG: M55 family metallopeptidase [Candidatus Riflebacteria bacterium]|nr:M55 family metallopeptidase [Candidatus Riflebacteria bacterium]
MASSVYIIADIEGSTGCLCAQDARLLNDGWVRACVELSRDVDLIARRLLDNGVERVRVKDFHRTGYNIFRKFVDSRVEIDQGYRAGPIPGIGKADGFDCLMMVGMHAASGTNGFIPHTLTSKFASVEVNGCLITEAELFASSVAEAGLVPLFFSGCPVACAQAAAAIPNLHTFALEKPLVSSPQTLREAMAESASMAMRNVAGNVYRPAGPFSTIVRMRDGNAAALKMRKRWKLDGDGDTVYFKTADIRQLYCQLIRLAYLNPVSESFLDLSLKTANLAGLLLQAWARYRARSACLIQDS